MARFIKIIRDLKKTLKVWKRHIFPDWSFHPQQTNFFLYFLRAATSLVLCLLSPRSIPLRTFGEQGGRKKNNVTLLIKSHYLIKYTHLLSKSGDMRGFCFLISFILDWNLSLRLNYNNTIWMGSAHLVQRDRTWSFLY